MDYLQKALSLFETGIPTHKEYEEAILVPRKELSILESRKDSEKIDAVGYYIDAYNGLLAGEVNMACIIVLDDKCFEGDMPPELDTERLRELRASIVSDNELDAVISAVREKHGCFEYDDDTLGYVQ